MAIESADPSWFQWAIGGVVTAGALVAAWLKYDINSLRDRVDADGSKIAEDAKTYATRQDITDLGRESRQAHSDLREHIDRRFGEMTQAISSINGGKR